METMENYTSNKDIYIKRMNQTAKSKFAVVEPYLSNFTFLLVKSSFVITFTPILVNSV